MQIALVVVLYVGALGSTLSHRLGRRMFSATLDGRHTLDRFSRSFQRPLPLSDPPPPTPANHSTYGLNVAEYGAKGDGTTDDTKAFQAALDAAFSLGGIVVLVPAGQFLLAGNITIPRGVTLTGTYRYVPAHNSGQQKEDQPDDGSVILATGHRGDENGPCLIQVDQIATLVGFTIYYPDQKGDEVPQPYPWSVCLNGINSAVTDVECLNCWNAIRAVAAHRHYIARIQGQPINIGVFVDQTYDIGRVEDVHFNPWFSSNPTYCSWQLLHGRAFVFARTDWEYVFNTFAFAYGLGYHFVKSSAGSCNGNFLGIGADMCPNASVQVDSADRWGILITNGEFTSFIDKKWGKQVAEPTQILVTANNSGAVRISNSAFWGPSYQVAKISGSGTTGFADCTFSQWDAGKMGRAAIEVADATGNLIVSGCDFQKDGSQINLGTTLARAVVTGNVITGATQISGKASNTQVGLNADSTKTD